MWREGIGIRKGVMKAMMRAWEEKAFKEHLCNINSMGHVMYLHPNTCNYSLGNSVGDNVSCNSGPNVKTKRQKCRESIFEKDCQGAFGPYNV